MHEAGIADRILDVVVARALEEGARRITAIHLEAGILAGVSEEALRFHWEQHAAGTPAEGAVLHLVQTDEPTDLRLVAIDVEEEVERRQATGHPASTAPAVSFTCISLGGLSLMERLVGARRAILVEVPGRDDR